MKQEKELVLFENEQLQQALHTSSSTTEKSSSVTQQQQQQQQQIEELQRDNERLHELSTIKPDKWKMSNYYRQLKTTNWY